jgi:hypothetical protein
MILAGIPLLVIRSDLQRSPSRPTCSGRFGDIGPWSPMVAGTCRGATCSLPFLSSFYLSS